MVSSNANTLALVTGATGFVGTEVSLAFLKHGFSVRGTARSQKKADEWSAQHSVAAEGRMSWSIVEDIVEKDAFAKAIKGVTLVAHTASPFHYNVKDNEVDMLIPALKGTTELLQAAASEPSVKRVVITSSFASVLNMANGAAVGTTYNDDDWNPATYDEAKVSDNVGFVYCASKKVAEEAAFDFVKANNPSFSLTTLCPPIVFGPPNQVISSLKDLNTSTEGIWGLVDAAEIPATSFPVFVDVRDLAELHVLAVTKDAAKGQRYLLIADHFDNSVTAEILRTKFPEQAHRIPKGAVTFSEHFKSDSSKVQKQLDFKFTSFEKSVVDTATALFALEKELKA